MLVRGFDHFTIRTEKLEETKTFYINLLDLKEGNRPKFEFLGYWLYLDKQPIFHLAEIGDAKNDGVNQYLGARKGATEGAGGGCIDHLAFRIEGYGDLLEKSKQHNLEFFERTVPDIKEHQCFFKDPNGITIELIFHDEEYQLWKEK